MRTIAEKTRTLARRSSRTTTNEADEYGFRR
jgi:hypothetical protein